MKTEAREIVSMMPLAGVVDTDVDVIAPTITAVVVVLVAAEVFIDDVVEEDDGVVVVFDDVVEGDISILVWVGVKAKEFDVVVLSLIVFVTQFQKQRITTTVQQQMVTQQQFNSTANCHTDVYYVQRAQLVSIQISLMPFISSTRILIVLRNYAVPNGS